MSGVVSCLCWVDKGAAKNVPDKIVLEKNELEELIASDGKSKHTSKPHNDSDEDDIEKLYDLDNYSEDEDDVDTDDRGVLPSLAGLATYASNDDDPLVTVKDIDDEESDDDFTIRPDDNLLLVGKANESLSSIEVHVYNEEDNHSFCHHEVLINAYPLAIEWLDYDPDEPDVKGNFFAVGTMLPVVEIWDIDLVDAPAPIRVLGVMEKKSKKKTKLKSKKKDKPPCDSHTDAIMALSWNRIVRSILASAGADNTVRVWDLSESKSLLVLEHPDKVQTLQWHPSNPSLLASGCYDGITRLYNCETGNLIKHWKLSGEVEKLLWNHFNPDLLLVSTDQMKVVCVNTSSDTVHFTLDAHADAVTDLSLSCKISGLLITCSIDDTISFWDIESKTPVFLYSRTLHMGGGLCARFCIDSPYTIAVGGQSSAFNLINVLTLPPLHAKCKQVDHSVPVQVTNPTSGDNDDSLEIGDIDLYKESKPAKAKHKSSGVSVSNKKVQKKKKRKLDD